MNRFYSLLLLLLSCFLPWSAQAQRDERTSAALVLEFTQLRYGKTPMKATMPAVELIKRNPKHKLAINFLRKDFEKAEQAIQDELEQIAFANTLEEAQRRYELVKLLAQAYDALTTLELPLEGEGWSWHPGIKYYAGNLSEAQTDLIKIAEENGLVAANRNEPQEAYRCYATALNCLTDSGEIRSNRQHYARVLKHRGDGVASDASNAHLMSIAHEFYEGAAKLNPEDELLQTRAEESKQALEALQQAEEIKLMEDTLQMVADTLTSQLVAPSADTVVVKDKYTFGDFFDALDLPTVLGVGFNPGGVESATFNSAMRLGWRQHKNYGLFSYITYDTHSNTYDSLQVKGTNVRTGEVWYNEIGISIGYRLPLVANIRKFYQNPHFHAWDFFASVQPGVSIATVKNMVPFAEEQDAYVMENFDHVVPTMRFSAGIEWFIFSNFAVFAEAAYTQHITPTIIEQAAIKKGTMQRQAGPVTISVGLSLFFT